MKLLIAEKPSVARGDYRALLQEVAGENFQNQQGYLRGQEYCISWCLGHIVTLEEPASYGWSAWRMQDLPLIPEKWKFQVDPDKREQYAVLKKLCDEADEIINGGDAGREGELIIRLVVLMSGNSKKLGRRLWTNSMVMEDLKKSWDNMKDSSNYDGYYRSAGSRAKADWIVGMTCSRGYSIATSARNISVGRVQTPTLALIVKRDHEIANWKESFYYELHALWKDIDFTYVRDDLQQFEKPESLEKVKAECEGQEGKLVKFTKKTAQSFPPKPFDLTELQKTVSKRLGIEPAETLSIAQALYERHKVITYPRTDSEYLPENMKDEAWGILQKVVTDKDKPYLRDKSDKLAFFNSKKVSDHFAIIPTGKPARGLSEKEQKVYNLICKRFVIAWMRPHRYKEYQLEIEVAGHRFKARATHDLDLGWKELFKKGEEKEDKEAQSNHLKGELELKKGDMAAVDKLEVREKKRSKPQHYTSDTLLTAMKGAGREIDNDELREAMKERGLGTPATQAQIIETLFKREFVKKSGKKITATDRGKAMIDIVDPDLASAELTGEWEYKLRRMERGDYGAKQYMDEIETFIRELVPKFAGANAGALKESMDASLPDCPACKKSKMTVAKPGYFCMDSEGCGLKVWRKFMGKALSDKQVEELVNHGETKEIKGFMSYDREAGKYNRDKTFAARLKISGSRVVPVYADGESAGNELKVKCPECDIALLRGRYGIYCPEHRNKCGLSIPVEWGGVKLSEEQQMALLEKGKTEKIEGFKKKNGNGTFSAELKLMKIDDRYRVRYDFGS